MIANTLILLGNTCHVVAILVILARVSILKNASGFSRKSQELFLIAYMARFTDLFADEDDDAGGAYVFMMKCFLLSMTAFIVVLLSEPTSSSHSQIPKRCRNSEEEFDIWRLVVVPVAAFTILAHVYRTVSKPPVCRRNDLWGPDCSCGTSQSPLEVTQLLLMEFSIGVEAVALFPQVLMFYKSTRRKDYEHSSLSVVRGTIILMTLYPLFYALSWLERSMADPNYKHHVIVYIACASQLIIGSIGLFWPSLGGRSRVNSSTPTESLIDDSSFGLPVMLLALHYVDHIALLRGCGLKTMVVICVSGWMTVTLREVITKHQLRCVRTRKLARFTCGIWAMAVLGLSKQDSRISPLIVGGSGLCFLAFEAKSLTFAAPLSWASPPPTIEDDEAAGLVTSSSRERDFPEDKACCIENKEEFTATKCVRQCSEGKGASESEAIADSATDGASKGGLLLTEDAQMKAPQEGDDVSQSNDCRNNIENMCISGSEPSKEEKVMNTSSAKNAGPHEGPDATDGIGSVGGSNPLSRKEEADDTESWEFVPEPSLLGSS